jgi:hypothetical protein
MADSRSDDDVADLDSATGPVVCPLPSPLAQIAFME